MPSAECPHQGIELDRVDFPFSHSNPTVDPKDARVFVNSLFQEIMKKDSFLSFTNQIKEVNAILKMKYASAGDIASVILKDQALSARLMQLVNSSFYGKFSNKRVTTLSEAMIILGTEEIKLAAASLKIFDFMQDPAHVRILKDRALKALQRSIVARQITMDENFREREAVQITAMIYDLGEYLVTLFAPGVALQVEMSMGEGDVSREQASRNVIGISYKDLGRLVASRWRLPPSIISAMKPVARLDILKKELSMESLQQYICSFADELCHIEADPQSPEGGREISDLAERYRSCLDIPASRAADLLKTAVQKIANHSAIFKSA